MTERGSDDMLADYGRPWRLLLPVAIDAARSWAEEVRVLATEPVDDPGVDHPAPAPPEDDGGGFDPLPPDTP